MPRNIENGEALLERQMTPRASGMRPRQGFGPEHFGRFGGGTSPLRTRDTIRERVNQAGGYRPRVGTVNRSADASEGQQQQQQQQ